MVGTRKIPSMLCMKLAFSVVALWLLMQYYKPLPIQVRWIQNVKATMIDPYWGSMVKASVELTHVCRSGLRLIISMQLFW